MTGSTALGKRAQSTIHAIAWVVWLGSIVGALAATRNPIYLGLILAWIAVVTAIVKWVLSEAGRDIIPISPLRFGVIVVTISAIFNALSVHVGTTVLLRLPHRLPLIGGPITLEALVYGALNGLVLAGLFAAFAVVNRVLSIRELVQLVPRAYYSLAVVVSIAVTFVPTTLRQYRQIREAQIVRGHRLRGLRSWLPLLLPLLTGGLERALQLAEAMVARGFAGAGVTVHDTWTRTAVILGLPAVAGGMLLRLVWGYELLGLLIVLIGVVLLLGGIWFAGRRHPHTVYRPAPWRIRDWIVTAGALVTAWAFFLPLPGLDRSSLFYYPYPSLTWPGFSLVLGIATWGLLAPGLVLLVSGGK